eukprot:TRINITY_DN0_c20_g3_i1.p1 TRINITY_DN0_c20_g3~~TRINITY_DN0_c20_g3_i1.p1  ORF type:complete len:58 (-),score=4.87 TRINITY_DN0_c20_g3_i1:93-266(-)
MWIRNFAKMTKSFISHRNDFFNTDNCFQSTATNLRSLGWKLKLLLSIFEDFLNSRQI